MNKQPLIYEEFIYIKPDNYTSSDQVIRLLTVLSEMISHTRFITPDPRLN